jgi:serine phosphatase RsbU (regulator of sigma subunit)
LTGRDNLGTALKNINDAFAEDLTPERFATFVAIVLQGDSGHVELLSAGHAPLFLFSARDQSVQSMDAQVLPLGIVPEMDGVIPVDLRLQPGDIVLLVTDGFFEWENPLQEQFGSKRLAEVLHQHSHNEPDVIIAEIYNSVVSFSQGTPQKDDLTAVLIKCMATQSAVERVELESDLKQTNPATFSSAL